MDRKESGRNSITCGACSAWGLISCLAWQGEQPRSISVGSRYPVEVGSSLSQQRSAAFSGLTFRVVHDVVLCGVGGLGEQPVDWLCNPKATGLQ